MKDAVYYLDQFQLANLQSILFQLHGNGASLGPDKRRDMANLMSLVLTEIEAQKENTE